MQIILLDDVPGVGEAGDIVKVKSGYGRNYLLPQGLAQHATREGLNRIASIRKAGAARRIKRISEVKDKIAALEGKTVVIPMKVGSETKIFGAVTTLLLSEKMKEQHGLEIDRRYIVLAEPIKYLGTYEVVLKAGTEASTTVTVEVVNEAEEAAPASAKKAVPDEGSAEESLGKPYKSEARRSKETAQEKEAANAAEEEREEEAARIEEKLSG